MRFTFRGVSLVIGESYDPELRMGGAGPVHAFYLAQREQGMAYGVLLGGSVWLEVAINESAVESMARAFDARRISAVLVSLEKIRREKGMS